MSSITEFYWQNSGLKISFDCQKCGDPIDDDIEDAAYDWSTERMSDGIGTANSRVICTNCDEEYDVEVVAKPGEKEVLIANYPGIIVRFHDDTFNSDHDDFMDDVPYDAYDVYQQSSKEIGEIDLSSAKMAPVKHQLLKMIYLQHVVMLEAYLSDRLLKLILADDKKLIALIGGIQTLRDFSPPLIQIAKDPDIVKRTAKNYLQLFSFHNFEGVAKLYSAVLKVNIFADDANATEMGDIREKRHHLVHRNGRDKDDKFVAVTVLDVLRVRKLSHEMVERIEGAYRQYRQKKKSEDDSFPF
ncbi:hypothetical protein [Ensifer canadensis]